MKFSTILGLALVSGVQGNASGSGTCSHDLTSIDATSMPGKTNHAMEGGGFTFTGIPATGFSAGQTYTISVGNPSKQIKGFLAYAIDTTDAASALMATRVGTIAAGTGGDTKPSCTEGPTATHTTGTAAASKSFKWTAPANILSVSFYGIAYDGTDFWNPMATFTQDTTQVAVNGVKTCTAGICDCTGMTSCTCGGSATCNGNNANTVVCAGTGDCFCGSAATCTCASTGKCCKEAATTFSNSKSTQISIGPGGVFSGSSDAGCPGMSQGSSLATSVFSLAVGAVVALAL